MKLSKFNESDVKRSDVIRSRRDLERTLKTNAKKKKNVLGFNFLVKIAA